MLTSADEEGSIPLNGFDSQPVEWFDESEPLPHIAWTDSTYVFVIGSQGS